VRASFSLNQPALRVAFGTGAVARVPEHDLFATACQRGQRPERARALRGGPVRARPFAPLHSAGIRRRLLLGAGVAYPANGKATNHSRSLTTSC
jgi:hypothetical protein